MAREHVQANIENVLHELRRPGFCLKVLIDTSADLGTIVPNPKVCLSTPMLLREAGLDPFELDPTNDLGDKYQFTLWLPPAPTDTLVELWSGFRGPFRKEEVSNEWNTEDLRGFLHPGP